MTAQMLPISNQWQETKALYNSATVGTREDLYITALYRMQWIGIKGAPVDMLLLSDIPLNFLGKQHGVGITISGQKKGLFINSELKGQYDFQLSLMKGILSIGLEAGLFNSSFDGTKIFIPDDEGLSPNDPALPQQQVSGHAFDMGLGLYYTHRNLYVGLAATHLFEPKIALGTNHFIRIRRNYTLMAGYNILPSNSLLTWHPGILAVSDFQSWRIDLTLEMAFNQRYFAQVMYRWGVEAGFSVGMKFGKIRVGYAFSMPTSELARGNYGTHELVLSYAIPKTKKKDLGIKKKSIRLL